MPLLFALLALSFVSTVSANPFRWTTFTSTSSVRDVLVTDDNMWLGTSGGLVRFDPQTGEFETFNNTRGLAMNATVGLGEDAQGWIWIVAPDGRITRMNPATGQTKIISDLQDEIFEVSSIVTVEDEMFLGANNGIYRFAYYPIVDNYRVSERVRVLGNFPTGVKINDMIVHNGFLYATTISGLARAPLTTEQFSAPASWTDYTIDDGLPENNVQGLGSQGDLLWVATESQTVSFNGTDFGLPIHTDEIINHIVEFRGDLIAASESKLYKLQDNSWVALTPLQYGLASAVHVSIDGEALLAIGRADLFERPGGIQFFDGNSLSPLITPKGIGGNVINTIEFDVNGNLWAATAGMRNGVSKLEDGVWTAYTRSDTLDGKFWRNAPSSAAADEFGGMWFGSGGGGVIYYRDGEISRYSPTDTIDFDENGNRLARIPGSNSYYCETRVGRMNTGEILITNLGAEDGRYVAAVSNNWLAQGNNPAPWTYYVPEAPSVASINQIDEIYGDPFGRFFVGASRNGNYTYVCNPRGTISDTTDDVWDSYDPIELQDAATTCFIDINREVLSFAVDHQNYLWVGTPGGAYYSQGGLGGNLSQLRFICLYDLPVGNRVNDIHVDSQDNKWFATDNGVAVLDPAFSWIHVFQTSSSIDYASDLASNGTTSITSNPVTGEVWIATGDGLSRLQTPYVSRKPDLDKVVPYPNPFRADGTQTMYIDSDDLGGRFDELRVFTLGGRLVRELTWAQAISTGWNGRNSNGDLVAGGVYLVVATSSDGHSATGKIAVLGR
jgi:ligand-binding sensor domain-containing protein